MELPEEMAYEAVDRFCTTDLDTIRSKTGFLMVRAVMACGTKYFYLAVVYHVFDLAAVYASVCIRAVREEQCSTNANLHAPLCTPVSSIHCSP